MRTHCGTRATEETHTLCTANAQERKAGSAGSTARRASPALPDVRRACVACAWAPFSARSPSRARSHRDPQQRHAKQHAKPDSAAASQHERLARDRRQAQRRPPSLGADFEGLGAPRKPRGRDRRAPPETTATVGQIVGLMCPPLFGCRTNSELCRARGWDKTCPRVYSVHCPSAPGSSGSGAWAWRC